MRQTVVVFNLCLLWLFSLGCQADARDLAWEQEIATKLTDSVVDAEVVRLGASGQEFLGLFSRQTSEKAAGAAIILHGMGAHADWPRLISPLRQRLPEQGWTTLSIQLPLVAIENPIENYGKTLTAAADRIEAAIRYLRKQKFLNIVIIGHSFGAASALHYLAGQNKPKVLAVAAIGLQEYGFLKPPIDVLDLIEKTTVPLLDIYGSRDYRRVIEQAPDRRLAAKKANNQNYRQMEIEGAGHYYYKMEDLLARRIRGWLDKAAPGVSIMVDQNFDADEEENEYTAQ